MYQENRETVCFNSDANLGLAVERKKKPFFALISSFLLGSLSVSTVNAEENEVLFPQNYKQGEHYATVNRGNIREELYTSLDAILATKNNQPFPDGTIIMMEDFRDDLLYRYIVMEKRIGWNSGNSDGVHAGDWKFQSFNPDQSVQVNETLQRCSSCHASQSSSDYVFTSERMKDFN